VSVSTSTLLVEVIISSIALPIQYYNNFQVFVGDMTGLIWVPFSRPLKVESDFDSLGYTPVTYNDEDVKEGRCSMRGFIARYKHAGKALVYGWELDVGSPSQGEDILCYKV
jgi:hypothetical protein